MQEQKNVHSLTLPCNNANKVDHEMKQEEEIMVRNMLVKCIESPIEA